MKTIKYLVLSVFIIGQVSCSSDDDGIKSSEIIGSWSITEGYVEPATINIDFEGMSVPVEISGNFIDIGPENRLFFKEDKTFSSITGNISLELDMIVMGVPQTQSIEMNDVFGEGTWELSGNKLKIRNENGTSIPYTIHKLTNEVLEISANVKDMVVDGGTNPILDSLDINVKMKLKRV